MRFSSTFKIVGLLLMMFSLSMLPPIGVYLWYRDGSLVPFIIGFIVTFLTGYLLWRLFRTAGKEIKAREGFLVVVLFWTVLSTFGAIPFYCHFYPHLSFTNALFESVSGLTTTGGSVFSHLDRMPHAILYYRQQLTLLGGVGVIVLALAILPLLGIGGMQLYIAEAAGPQKTNKLRPRLAQTAKALWLIYAGLVFCCAVSYWLAGMEPFDAIGESFSTISTAGFNIHDNSFAFYRSHTMEFLGILFMLLGATNFGLHFHFIHEGRFSVYFKDPEFRFYLKVIGVVVLTCFIILVLNGAYHHNITRTFMHALFSVTTASTTTGFVTTDFDEWPTFLPYLLMFMALIGGCGGSTAGGIKMLRFMLLKAQSARELKRLIHPRAIFSIRLGKQILEDNVIQAVWGFLGIFIALFIFLLLLLMAAGLDIRSAFGALAATITNTGVGLGKTAVTFETISNPCKWILIFAMLAGRLEIFTIFVLLTPDYWRK